LDATRVPAADLAVAELRVLVLPAKSFPPYRSSWSLRSDRSSARRAAGPSAAAPAPDVRGRPGMSLAGFQSSVVMDQTPSWRKSQSVVMPKP
jgi:hypothetical protein